MSKRILGIDIDGVLADFNNAFADILRDVSGRNLLPADVTSPPVWDWPEHYGYTKPETGAAWDRVRTSEDFWEGLPILSGAELFLNDLSWEPKETDVYFITARPGRTAKFQSENWLELYGYFPATVVMALPNKEQDNMHGVGYSKGVLAEALRLTHFVDDKSENCEWVKKNSDKTQVFLLDHNYNRCDQPKLTGLGVQVIKSLREFTARALEGCDEDK